MVVFCDGYKRVHGLLLLGQPEALLGLLVGILPRLLRRSAHSGLVAISLARRRPWVGVWRCYRKWTDMTSKSRIGVGLPNRRALTILKIWCWIDSDWKGLRILTYYLPIWVCIALSICIYFAVGFYVFRQRNQLRNLSLSNPSHDATAGQRDSGEKVSFVATVIVRVLVHDIPEAYTWSSLGGIYPWSCYGQRKHRGHTSHDYNNPQHAAFVDYARCLLGFHEN